LKIRMAMQSAFAKCVAFLFIAIVCTSVVIGQTNDVKVAAPTLTDAGASKFMLSCAGCHSLSGVKLNGPALNNVLTWPPDQLKAAIKRMEKNVGPLSDAHIEALAQFLKDPTANDILKVEQEKIAKMYAAKLDPPSAAIGRALFFGTKPLKNGGLGCATCHNVKGSGGKLGPDLSKVYSKMGETPLISAIEKASFKVMEPSYRRHPITKQEAIHLARYFSTLDSNKISSNENSYAMTGVTGAAVFLVGMTVYYRRHRYGRREPIRRRRK
jgi:mono/diheme cytochrome c family protein